MSRLDTLCGALKSGEYDGNHIMQAWLLCGEVKQLQLANQSLREAAKAVIERWDSPNWKDAKHTRDYIYALRDAVNAAELSKPQPKEAQALRAAVQAVIAAWDSDKYKESAYPGDIINKLRDAVNAEMKESKT